MCDFLGHLSSVFIHCLFKGLRKCNLIFEPHLVNTGFVGNLCSAFKGKKDAIHLTFFFPCYIWRQNSELCLLLLIVVVVISFYPFCNWPRKFLTNSSAEDSPCTLKSGSLLDAT